MKFTKTNLMKKYLTRPEEMKVSKISKNHKKYPKSQEYPKKCRFIVQTTKDSS